MIGCIPRIDTILIYDICKALTLIITDNEFLINKEPRLTIIAIAITAIAPLFVLAACAYTY